MKDLPEPPTMDEAIAWCNAEIDAIHASYSTNPPIPRMLYIPPGSSEADRICMTCGGTGTRTDVHAYGDPTDCACYRCDGEGVLP